MVVTAKYRLNGAVYLFSQGPGKLGLIYRYLIGQLQYLESLSVSFGCSSASTLLIPLIHLSVGRHGIGIGFVTW